MELKMIYLLFLILAGSCQEASKKEVSVQTIPQPINQTSEKVKSLPSFINENLLYEAFFLRCIGLKSIIDTNQPEEYYIMQTYGYRYTPMVLIYFEPKSRSKASTHVYYIEFSLIHKKIEEKLCVNAINDSTFYKIEVIKHNSKELNNDEIQPFVYFVNENFWSLDTLNNNFKLDKGPIWSLCGYKQNKRHIFYKADENHSDWSLIPLKKLHDALNIEVY